ncbi:MAG TPA: response regulator transcription factor [Armatimonadota bacterium]
MTVQAYHHPGVVLVDDHAAVRQALAALLEEEGLCVWGQAAGRADALACVDTAKPDAVLVDLSLGDDDGLTLVEDLHRLGIPVVVCSSHEDPEHVRQALAAGARAYVAKREAGVALAHAIREALDGWILVSPRAADDLTETR